MESLAVRRLATFLPASGLLSRQLVVLAIAFGARLCVLIPSVALLVCAVRRKHEHMQREGVQRGARRPAGRRAPRTRLHGSEIDLLPIITAGVSGEEGTGPDFNTIGDRQSAPPYR